VGYSYSLIERKVKMIDFQTNNEGVWYLYDEDYPDNGGIKIRLLGDQQMRKIQKLVTKKKRKFARGGFTEEVIVDEEKESTLILDYCIEDWAGTMVDGEELECTMANKQKASKSLEFTKFVLGCIKHLSDQSSAIESAKRKNLKSSSNGKLQNQSAKNVPDSTKTEG